MMGRSFMVAAVAVFGAVTIAAAADAPGVRQEAPPAARIDLRALFERAPGVTTHGASGMSSGATTVEVMLARVGPDGKLVKVCVNNEAAARRFMEAPAETLRTKKAQDQ